VKFEKWSPEKVEVTADALQAFGKMQEYEQTTLLTNSIVGRRTLKIHVLQLDERLKSFSSQIQLGVVFGETEFDSWLSHSDNAWCLWTGGAEWLTYLCCRNTVTESKEMQIRTGSYLQMIIDTDNKTLEFTVDRVPLTAIKMDITDLQIKQLRAALLICGQTQIEMSGE